MYNKKAFNTYVEIDDTLSGAEFEKKWFESVIMVLQRVQNNYYNPVVTHVKLLEVCNGLEWVQDNLNDKLSTEHKTLLENIYSCCITIINSAIILKDFIYLDIVISSVKTVMEPYNK